MNPKSKTVAVWLTLFGGPLSLHRVYLHGRMGVWGWLLLLCSSLGLIGIWRVRAYGVDDRLIWILLPVFGVSLAACSLTAIFYGLQETEVWNRNFNAELPPDHAAGATSWITIIGLVAALLLGAPALLSSIAFGFQRYFEYQSEASSAERAAGSVSNAPIEQHVKPTP
jgi:hypothetical protein